MSALLASRRGSGRIAVVPMKRRHLRGVVAIEEMSSHRPWSLGLFLGELRMPTSRSYVVALRGHDVVGFAGLMLTGSEAHVTNVAVHPDHRRQQVATRMLLHLMEEARERGVTDVTLEVRVGNPGAQELYRRFGFAPGGIRRNYYADIGEDALIMWAHDLDGEEARRRLDAVAASLTEADPSAVVP